VYVPYQLPLRARVCEYRLEIFTLRVYQTVIIVIIIIIIIMVQAQTDVKIL